MLARIKTFIETVKVVPHDAYAVFMLLWGGILVICGHKDEGMLVIGGGLSVFKGPNAN